MTSDNKTAFETLTCLAIVCLAVGLWIRRRETAARRWPQVSGAITGSNTIRKPTGRGGEEVLPLIDYEFVYMGRTFRTSHWRVANYSTGSLEDASSVTSRYSLGVTVSVFVNQAEPMKSVLEYGSSPLSWVPIGFGIFFALMTLVPLLDKH